MSTIEPAPSPSPLSKLSKFRRGKKSKDDNLSTQSLVSTSTDGDDLALRQRSSVEGVMEKLKVVGSRRSSDDRRQSGDSRRLSKLVSGKLRRRKSDNSDDGSRPNAASTTNLEQGDELLPRSRSDASLGLAGSGGSSLLTEDSDTER